MKKKTILITGGAGFIGSNLAVLFKKNFSNINVISLDNLKRNGSGLNLSRLRESGVKFVHGDVRNPEDLDAVGKFDVLIECSAEPSVMAGYNSSSEFLINTNLFGTVNCLEQAKKYQADIIFLSTSRVYPISLLRDIKLKKDKTRFALSKKQSIQGISQKGISEDFPLNKARSLYGATKLASEILMLEYINMYKIRGVINRCSIVTGPWQMGKVDQGVVALWVARHLLGKKLKYIGFDGSGQQVRDILHVADLFNLISLQIKNMNKFNGNTYNVGGGNPLSVSLLELTKLCQEITEKEITISKIKKTSSMDIPYFITDSSKIMKESSWKPEKNLHDIIEDIAKWITNNKQILQTIF